MRLTVRSTIDLSTMRAPGIWFSIGDSGVRGQVDLSMPGSWVDHATGVIDHVAQASLLDSLARPNGITLGELQRTARTVLSLVLGLPVLRDVIAGR